jgi:mRNA interferase RelE/StbE
VTSGSPRYRVDVNRSAVPALAALPRPVQQHVAGVLDGLAENPRPPGTVALKEYVGLCRLRVAGDYRLIYRVDDDARAVLVRVIGQRRDVYRSL